MIRRVFGVTAAATRSGSTWNPSSKTRSNRRMLASEKPGNPQQGIIDRTFHQDLVTRPQEGPASKEVRSRGSRGQRHLVHGHPVTPGDGLQERFISLLMKGVQLQPLPGPGQVLHLAMKEVASHEVVGDLGRTFHPSYVRAPSINHWSRHSRYRLFQKRNAGMPVARRRTPNTDPLGSVQKLLTTM